MRFAVRGSDKEYNIFNSFARKIAMIRLLEDLVFEKGF
jgi:hypothetical protein